MGFTIFELVNVGFYWKLHKNLNNNKQKDFFVSQVMLRNLINNASAVLSRFQFCWIIQINMWNGQYQIFRIRK